MTRSDTFSISSVIFVCVSITYKRYNVHREVLTIGFFSLPSGLLLIANSYVVGQFFGDSANDIFTFSNYSLVNEFTDYEISDRNADDYLYTIICIVIGTILVDFSTDALLNPSRAYVLDVCIAGNYCVLFIV